ncbi:MAG: hypothetical protein PHZ19_12115 [Candidatus Thermoplasmatota archaeon]|nr:hypothetical protein [Candidatus Thermoplasmatota archaeon]
MLQVIAGETIHVPYIGVEPDGTAAAVASVYIRRMDTGEYWDDDAPGGADWVAGPEANDMTAGDADGVFWYEWAADATLGRGTAVTIECAATDCISAAHSVTILRDDIADSAEVLTRATPANVTAAQAAIMGADDRDLSEVYTLVAGISGGIGAHNVSLYVHDDAGNPVAGQVVTMPTAGVLATLPPDGLVRFNLDPGTYSATIRSSNAYTPDASYTVEVAADGTLVQPAGGILVVQARAMPAPPAPDCYVLYNTERVIEQGDAPYAGIEVYVQDLHWYGRQDATADAIRSPIGQTFTADADGLWSFEIAKAAFDAGATLTLVRTRTMADATTQTETINAVLDADAADASDRVALADLKLTRT